MYYSLIKSKIQQEYISKIILLDYNIKHQDSLNSYKEVNEENSMTCRTFLKKISSAFIVSLLAFSIISCSFSMGDSESINATDIAHIIEYTLSAEKAMTLEAELTSLAIVNPAATADTNSTLQAQQATIDAQNTAIVSSSTPLPGATETPTLVSDTSPILIEDWKMAYWVPMTSGCRDNDFLCWRTNDDDKLHGGGDMVLFTKNSYFIDQNWNNPKLVFWHKGDIKRNADVMVQSNGRWVTVKSFNQLDFDWKKEYADLSMFKGQEIIIQFSASGQIPSGKAWNSRSTPPTYWYVQEIQIFPDLTPP